jgi:hypothetical protein
MVNMLKELKILDITFDFISKKEYDFNKDCVVEGVVKNAFLYGRQGAGKSTFVKRADFKGYQCITNPSYDINKLTRDIIYNQYDFLIIDNLNVHYEKLIEVCEALRQSKTQSILITHNTFMMNNDYTRPDCIFIKERFCNPVPLCELTDKDLREAHNLEKLYRANCFHYDYFKNGNGRK